MMAEPFCSLTGKDFRWKEPDFQDKYKSNCYYVFGPKEKFIQEDSEVKYDPAKSETLIKNMIKKRMRSTYQVSYCSREGDDEIKVDPFSDQFMVHFNKLYSEKTDPVPRPVDTAKRVHGYSRPEWYHTGHTTFQEEIGREGYNIFKTDFDRGVSRLYGKKQKAQQVEQDKTESTKSDDASGTGNPKTENKESPMQTCVICSTKFANPQCECTVCEKQTNGKAVIYSN